jgi:adenylate cyclase
MSDQPILRLFLPHIVAGFLVGVLYAGARYGSPVSGGLAGALCVAGFVSLERFVLRRNSGSFIRPLPFLAYFALRSVLYVSVIVFVIALVNEAAGAGFAGVRPFDLIFSLVWTVAVILFLSVNDLLGPGVLFAFAAGRYHTPRIEDRALLFIDMRASTAIAERLGELGYLTLLNRFVDNVSFAVAEAGGGIHKYVGDEVIATWGLAPGANPRACVSAVFAALDRITSQGPAYNREFGVVPDFRAALHCGPVAVGELGSIRKEIALIGDTMNTAARILEACRHTDNRVLASAALIERLATLPPGVTWRRRSSPCAARSADSSLMCWRQRGSREWKGRARCGNLSTLSEMFRLAMANDPGGGFRRQRRGRAPRYAGERDACHLAVCEWSNAS